MFDDLPQVPFESFNFHIFASQRALLATPTHCANYSVESVFKPWNSVLANQTSSPNFSLGSGPNGAPARRRCARSSRASWPAPQTRSPAPSAAST